MDAQRRLILAGGATGAALLLAHSQAAFAGLDDAGDMDRLAGSPPSRDGSRDFDFYLGRWHVDARRLKVRNAGSSDWEHYEATDECRLVLDGIGSIDDFRTEHFGGNFRGMVVRLYDAKSRKWTAWWATNRTGTMDPPVIGWFANGKGVFHGRDTDGDRPVLVRCIWSDIGPKSVIWEQAFSIDEGKTFETNAVFRMRRTGA